eukprot:TRINITY_DN61314_c0_g1_i1.p1 TRINITY_DN61314_c0_g1~~TRINITY_DN61314_c0_g1_i1.p1  ORF type:complete len:459 (+),score=76.86 TRINITY_DN61314_c0_g1_i1:25-1401(+)
MGAAGLTTIACPATCNDGESACSVEVSGSSRRASKNHAELTAKGVDLLTRYPNRMAVIVSDLSGFTSTTRKHGIIHFASIIIRKRQICLPILHKRGCKHIATEADNLIVAFPDVSEAVKAALDMRDHIMQHNSSLTEDRSHFTIKLNGIGIHCGEALTVDHHGEMLGATAEGAYQLGEDVCENGNIVISQDVMHVIENDSTFTDFTFEPGEEDTGHFAAGSYFRLNSTSKAGRKRRLSVCAQSGKVHGVDSQQLSSGVRIAATDDDRFLHPALLQLAERHSRSGEELEKLDTKIGEYMIECTALMFSMDLESAGSQVEAQVGLKLKTLAVIRPIFERHGGLWLEDLLWTFKTPGDGVNAALQAGRALENLSAREALGRIVTGIGLHMGRMLAIRGTDVHWGDPVNTASKLGQDLARDGAILISELVKKEADAAGISFQECAEQSYEKSKVKFICYRVR